ncbi:hypothetical protein NLU13_5590 [Sarocladium strictum]|uniref:Uncharacterized protein n=1 Tax=Sarocladium strictum TaxID=5046 RepID=A0AA39GH65_SARSR|nr:hypothetical protein NLU13_5590 [Sarocladium strictum]
MSSSDDSSSSVLGAPVSYVIIPLIGVVVFAATISILLLRRRRRSRLIYGTNSNNPHGANDWPGRPGQPHVHQNRGGTRWGPWGATRSQDGLNELGEAPPPYMGKKSGQDGGDIELGMPPEYHVAGPAPAVTTESRRH